MTDLEKEIDEIVEKLDQDIKEGCGVKNTLKVAALEGYRLGIEVARKVYRA